MAAREAKEGVARPGAAGAVQMAGRAAAGVRQVAPGAETEAAGQVDATAKEREGMKAVVRMVVFGRSEPPRRG